MVLHKHHSICSLKLKWLASYSCRWKNKTELFDLNLLCKKINLSWMVLTHTHFFSVLEIELRASYLPGTLPLSYIPSPKFWLFQSTIPSWWPIQSIWPQQADEPKVAHLCQTPWIAFISRVIYLVFPIRVSDTSTMCIFGLLQWKPSICLLSIFLLLRHSGLNDTTHTQIKLDRASSAFTLLYQWNVFGKLHLLLFLITYRWIWSSIVFLF